MKNWLNKYKEKFNDEINCEDKLKETKSKLNFNAKAPIGNKKLLIFSLSGIFVALAIIATVVSVVLINNYKNTPVYKGMNVVNSPLLVDLVEDDLDDDEIIDNEIDNDMPDVKVDDSISYYAKKNSTIVVEVLIDNPKDYEILSFTINNYKYQSFEFIEGSTGSKIRVKVEVGDKSGLELLTINELKYIDETKIKNARYDGNKTIKIGVEYENVPTNLADSRLISENSYSVSLKLNDLDSLIGSETIYRFYLFSDDRLVDKGSVSMPFKYENNKLLMNTDYDFVLSASLDLFDGKGQRSVYTYKDSFKTLSGLKNPTLTTQYDSITVTYDKVDSATIVKSELYLNDTLVKSVEGSDVSFNELYSNTEYKIRAYYEYSIDGKTYTDFFDTVGKTKEYNKPDIVGMPVLIADSLILDFTVEDSNSLIVEYKLEVYLDDVLYKEATSLDEIISLKNQTYNEVKVKIIIKYDLHDNLGIKEMSKQVLA